MAGGKGSLPDLYRVWPSRVAPGCKRGPRAPPPPLRSPRRNLGCRSAQTLPWDSARPSQEPTAFEATRK